MVRHMMLVLVLSLPLRVYYLMICTHNALWGVIMNSFDSTISYFGCVSFFCKICKVCSTGWHVHTFPVLHRLWCLLETWVARVLKVSDTNWLPCFVEILGCLSFIFMLHYYVLNELKMQILYRCLCMLLQLIFDLCFVLCYLFLEGIFHPLFHDL